jgi:hypothetical protein
MPSSSLISTIKLSHIACSLFCAVFCTQYLFGLESWTLGCFKLWPSALLRLVQLCWRRPTRVPGCSRLSRPSTTSMRKSAENSNTKEKATANVHLQQHAAATAAAAAAAAATGAAAAAEEGGRKQTRKQGLAATGAGCCRHVRAAAAVRCAALGRRRQR